MAGGMADWDHEIGLTAPAIAGHAVLDSVLGNPDVGPG